MTVARDVCSTLTRRSMRLPDLCRKLGQHDPKAIARCVKILSTSGHVRRLPNDFLECTKPYEGPQPQIEYKARRRRPHIRLRVCGETFEVPGRIGADDEGSYVEITRRALGKALGGA